MNLLAILLIVCSSAWMCQAYPHEKPHDHDHEHHHHHHDIIDLAAKIAASIRASIHVKDVSDESKTLKPAELMSCIPQDYRTKVHEQCDEKLHKQPGQDHTPPAVAECVLTMIKALDNVTGILDVAALKIQTIDISSLTADKKKSASDQLESCVESNFTIPGPPPFMAAKNNMTMDNMSPVTKKYSQRSNPMRVLICVAYALIENGCFSGAVDMKADLVAAPVGLDSSVQSGEDYYDYYGDYSYYG